MTKVELLPERLGCLGERLFPADTDIPEPVGIQAGQLAALPRPLGSARQKPESTLQPGAQAVADVEMIMKHLRCHVAALPGSPLRRPVWPELVLEG